jgi:uncharacterized protein YkwD
MKGFKKFGMVALLVTCLLPSTAQAATNSSTKALEQSTLSLLNDVRAEHGLAPLVAKAALRRSAVAHSQDMVARNYFEHDTKGGDAWSERVLSYFRPRRTVGENIGWGNLEKGTPEAMVEAWMASPPHRKNILNGAFKQIGVGVSTGSFLGYEDTLVYTTDFGG